MEHLHSLDESFAAKTSVDCGDIMWKLLQH